MGKKLNKHQQKVNEKNMSVLIPGEGHYEGEFKRIESEGKTKTIHREGYGKLTGSGVCYTGHWVNDAPHGSCSYLYFIN